jgi:drug/metabolite transporter (DMT)-like permease
MTRLATGDASAPALAPTFVTFGRAAVAGLLSIAVLLIWRAPLPRGRQWAALAFTGAGTVIGFPLFLALALRQVESMHAAVVTAILPLATAVAGSLWLRQRPSAGFWACAIGGSAMVAAFMAWKGGSAAVGTGWADFLLLMAICCAASGYVSGAALTAQLGAERVICWVLVLYLPLTIPVSLWSAPVQSVPVTAWAGFAYVALFSMWIGFFAWYRGLALGGTVRVSQVQLVQPFLSMLLSVPLLGERLDPVTVAFALAVIATVFIGRRMPIRPSIPATTPAASAPGARP